MQNADCRTNLHSAFCILQCGSGVLMSRFLDALHSGRVLLMDGAMGTELQRAGIADGACHELWNVTHPERVRAIHQAYVDAGAEVLLTNTFQANPPALARHGLVEKLVTLNRMAVSLARAVAGSDRFVLLDMGPLVDAATSQEFPEPHLMSRQRGCAGGTDALLLETCSSPRVRRVLPRADAKNREGSDRPLLLSLTYRRDARGKLCTSSGHPPEWFARRARKYGIAALGVNCGRDISMEDVIAIIRRYRSATDLPLFARPNAGTPTRIGERWVYPYTPEQMAARLPELLAAGVSMVGGCCGTTPDHIAAFRPVLAAWNARHEAVSQPCEPSG
jgi:5-methyltetrahydrofolate--homocysteine methyltransferase